MNRSFTVRPGVDALRRRVGSDGLILEAGRIGAVIGPCRVGAEVERRAGEGPAAIARIMPVWAVTVRGDVTVAGVVARRVISPVNGSVMIVPCGPPVMAPVVIVSGNGGCREKQGYD